MGNVPLRRPPPDSSKSLQRSRSVAPPMHTTSRRSSLHDSNLPRYNIRQNSAKFSARSTDPNADTGIADHHVQARNLVHPAPERYLMTMAQREMIRANWEASRDRRYDIARRIYGRAFNKRPDIREIYESMGAELWSDEAQRFADFVEVAIDNMDDLCAMENLCVELGKRHSHWRHQGFKPEFWVALAESMTKECVYLDAAVHPAGEVLEAWSKLVGLIFGWARDGYYERVRFERRQSRKTITASVSTSSRSLSSSSRSDSIEEPGANNCAIGTQLSSIDGSGSPMSDDTISS